MDLNKKYFGMTVMQLGILGGLGAIILILFCVIGVLVMRNGFGGGSAQQLPPTAPILDATNTPIILPTITPTITLTPAPYESLIPAGWVQHKTDLIEIWLPDNFKVADPKILGDTSNLAVPALVLSEAKTKTSLYQMIVGVSYEPLVGDSLDTYLNNKLSGLTGDTIVVDRRKVSLNSVEAIRITFEIRVGNLDVNDLTFVILDGSTIWYVEYAAEITEYFDNLPVFESSAKTFRVVR